MKRVHGYRVGVSEILATVILIAITLIAGVAVSGYAFGLFGSLGQMADVKVGPTAACSATAAGGTYDGITIVRDQCVIPVTNAGTASGLITACNIGTAHANTYSLHTAAASTIAAGASDVLVCTFTTGTFAGLGARAGSAVSGAITVNNNIIYWAGTFQA